jgi:hypothetical protein
MLASERGFSIRTLTKTGQRYWFGDSLLVTCYINAVKRKAEGGGEGVARGKEEPPALVISFGKLIKLCHRFVQD